ncbi:MAG TPA: DUF1080 domain-containing protein [Cyclobacteriaceae bacterium]|nr:DUF1080 domain-containing protein [Cyclobacteriaceae bacterium]
MKKPTLFSLLSLLTLINACTTEKKADEWIELFNGKDLSGWRANENEGTFRVEDGVIVANGARSHLFYVGDEKNPIDIKNFELNAEVMTHYRANSGIYFHTSYQQEGWPEKGYEVQVNNTHIGADDYKEVKKSGSLYSVRNVYKAFAKDSVWYHMNIRVEANHIRVRLDSILIVDYYEPASQARQASGTFALQGHDSISKVFFRNIKLKILPDVKSDALQKSDEGLPEVTEGQKQNFAFIDTRIFVDRNFDVDAALKEFYSTGVNLGLVATTSDDSSLDEFVTKYDPYPVFLGVNESSNLGAESRGKFDYVIGEITSFEDKNKNSFDVRKDQTISNAESFMDDYVTGIVNKLNMGTIDIWSSPTLLPKTLADDYNKLWTKERMLKVILAAKNNSVGIEVDNQLKFPGMEFLKLAKENGCLFALGGVYANHKMNSPDYFTEVIKQCGLGYKDIFIPDNN